MKKLVTLLFLLAATKIAYGNTTAKVIVPFEIQKSCIYFYCKVNDADSLKFLFDTGADGSVINEQSLNKVHLKVDGKEINTGSNGSNEVNVSKANIVTVGTIQMPKTALTIIPYENALFDGVYGTDLMKQFVIEIDYEKKELRFYDPADYHKDLAAYEKCKIYYPGNYFSIKGSVVINGKTYKRFFGLDSGADNVLTLAAPFAASTEVAKKLPKVGTAVSQGSDGSKYENPIVLLPEVKFGTKHFYNLVTDVSSSSSGSDAVNDKAGFYGNDFLKRFNTVIDFPGGYIYLKPNSLLYTSFFAD